ncbi:MAG: LacI family DNA-binding transcriptional regulator [Verrucomicrobia bacterium]|nr:LacI family DNA-binding transcriptional regulator [Verrucomicrobiota bacterium]
MPEGSSKVTMDGVARAAGVSKATVSRALMGSSLIGEGVRERVEEVAREMGYVRRAVRRPGERGILTVKLVLPPQGRRTSQLFYSFIDLVGGLKTGLRPAEVNILVETGGEEYVPYPHKKGGEVDAFVFAFHRPPERVLQELEERGAAVLVLNRMVRGVRHVVSDHLDAMRQLAVHLAERGVEGGCCFVGYEGIDDVVHGRLSGFVEGCGEAGIGFDEREDLWMVEGPEELTAAGVKEHYEAGVRCFVGVNDVAGAMVLQQVRELGLQVPGEVRVTGCDNAPMIGLTVPRLTTVDLSMFELAKEAGKRLYAEVIEGRQDEGPLLVGGMLLVGETT